MKTRLTEEEIADKKEESAIVRKVGRKIFGTLFLIIALTLAMLAVLTRGQIQVLCEIFSLTIFMLFSLATVITAASSAIFTKDVFSIKMEIVIVIILTALSLLIEKESLTIFTGSMSVLIVALYVAVRAIFCIVFDEFKDILD